MDVTENVSFEKTPDETAAARDTVRDALRPIYKRLIETLHIVSDDDAMLML